MSLGPEVGVAGSEMVWILGQGGQPPKLEAGIGATVSVSVSEEGSLDVSLDPGDGRGSLGEGEEEKAREEAAEEEEGEDPFTQCRGIPLYHFSMINDLYRAEAYSLAIKAALGDLEDASSARVASAFSCVAFAMRHPSLISLVPLSGVGCWLWEWTAVLDGRGARRRCASVLSDRGAGDTELLTIWVAGTGEVHGCDKAPG